MNRKRLAFVGVVAGISIVSPYLLATIAKKFPTSPVAKLNATLHAAESAS